MAYVKGRVTTFRVSKIDFTWNLNDREIMKYQNCADLGQKVKVRPLFKGTNSCILVILFLYYASFAASLIVTF